jgi:DNA replication protein DnaC
MTLLQEVQEQLSALSLKKASQSLEKLMEKAQMEDWSTLKTLNTLLAEERQARWDKAREKRLKSAGFPYMATIEEFDFAFQTSVTKKQMVQLQELTWLESAFNIMFLGPPSVGNYRKNLVMERN